MSAQLLGHEPFQFRVAYQLFPSDCEQFPLLTPLGDYIYKAVTGIHFAKTKGDLWDLKEKLDEIRRKDSSLSLEGIKQGFEQYLAALYPGCECKSLRYQFGQLLTIDTSIPYGAIEA